MDAQPERPWYRLHWGTVLTVFFVGLGWLSNGYRGISGVILGDNPLREPGGWPFWSIWAQDGAITDTEPQLLALDLGLMFGCLLAVAFVVARLGHLRFQFGLTSLISFMTAIAGVLALWRWNDGPIGMHHVEGIGNYHRFVPTDLAGSLSTLFAVGCAIYTICWLTLRAASNTITRLRRPAPAKVEIDGPAL